MLIDWFTVGAQIVNFLILVYLLKRFLYGPIIKAMDEREKKIAMRLEQAREQHNAAEQERAAYEAKSKALDGQKDVLLSAMKEDVDKTQKTMMEQVRTRVESVRANWDRALEQEKEAFLRDLKSRTGHHTYAIARQTLTDLADVELEGHIVRVFEQRLKNLDERERDMLKAALDGSKDDVVLRSAFDVEPETVEGVKGILESLKGSSVDLVLKTAPDVICGIELTVRGHKIAWSVAQYLESLEDVVSQIFVTGQKDAEEKTSREEQVPTGQNL